MPGTDCVQHGNKWLTRGVLWSRYQQSDCSRGVRAALWSVQAESMVLNLMRFLQLCSVHCLSGRDS